MKDYGLEVLEQYDIKVKEVRKKSGELFCVIRMWESCFCVKRKYRIKKQSV